MIPLTLLYYKLLTGVVLVFVLGESLGFIDPYKRYTLLGTIM